MLYSIIIINYNTPQLTINCINSLLSLPKPQNKEIIVVDNASADKSVETIEKEFKDRIKLIKSKVNLGFGGGNNKGAEAARGDLIVFLNSDTVVKKDIFKSCLDIFNKDKKVGVVSPGLKTEDGHYQAFGFGLFPTFWSIISGAQKKELSISKGGNIMEVDWVSGCALMIRKDLFQELGGWDEKYFLYYEDIDLCKRVKNQGYKVLVNLKTDIIHLGGRSLKKNKERKKHYYRSQDLYFKKHHSLFTYLGIKLSRDAIKQGQKLFSK